MTSKTLMKSQLKSLRLVLFTMTSCATVLSTSLTASAAAPAIAPKASVAAQAARPAFVANAIAKKGFNMKVFEAERERLRTSGLENTPKTVEERAALIAHISEHSGHDVLAIDRWVQTAKPDDLKKFSKKVGDIDPTRPLTPRRAEELFAGVMEVVHKDPRSFRSLLTRGFDPIERDVLMRWARAEFANKPFEMAMKDLGLLRDPSVLEHLDTTFKNYPNTIEVINKIALNSFFVQLVGSPILAPKLSLLTTQVLTADVREQIRNQGFDAVYPVLKAKYGGYAKFDTAWYYAQRLLTSSMMAFALTSGYPGLLASQLSAGAIPSDSTASQATLRLLDYLTRFSMLTVYQLTHPQENKSNLISQPKSDATVIGDPSDANLSSAKPPGANSQAATEAAFTTTPEPKQESTTVAAPTTVEAPSSQPAPL